MTSLEEDAVLRRIDAAMDTFIHIASPTPEFWSAVQEANACKNRWFTSYDPQELADADFWLASVGF